MTPESHAEYPDANAITQDVGRRHDLGSEISPPLSPRTQPPDYFEEGAPPGYQEASNKASKKLVKKITVIRLLTAILIITIFAVIVAAVVAKISLGKPSTGHKEAEGGMTETGLWTTLTVTSTFSMSNGRQLQVKTTTAPRPLVIPTQAHVAFNCPFFAQTTPGLLTRIDDSNPKPVCDALNREDAKNTLGVKIYSHENCRLSRASYLNCGWAMSYRCTASCQSNDDDQGERRDVTIDDWEWDAG